MLLYTGTGESKSCLEIGPKLKKLELKEKPLLQYHLEMLVQNKLFDIAIVTVKGHPLEKEFKSSRISKYLTKLGMAKEVIAKLNITMYVLKEEEDSTIQAMKLIADKLTKDLVIVHGQYLLNLNLLDALALHKINSSEMTLILKKQSELDERAKKKALNDTFNIYGIGKDTPFVYSMFNNFEATDSKGLSVHTSILKKCPSARMTLRSDICDTGVYIMRNIFRNPLEKLDSIDFDLVRFMIRNQFKRKLRDIIGSNQPDEDTLEIDELLDEELETQNKVVITACIKEAKEIALEMNDVNGQPDSDDEGFGVEEDGGNQQMTFSDSD